MNCECTPVVKTEFGAESGVTPSEAIIMALAEAENVAPTELDPLYDTIDLDALDRLFTTRDGKAEIPPRMCRFAVNNWNIFIHSDGSVVICDSERKTDPAPVLSKVSAD